MQVYEILRDIFVAHKAIGRVELSTRRYKTYSVFSSTTDLMLEPKGMGTHILTVS